ncbi:MAG: ABC transporter substrate-binding protein, partial [Cyanobacteria bacterium P01_H01_bin.15]
MYQIRRCFKRWGWLIAASLCLTIACTPTPTPDSGGPESVGDSNRVAIGTTLKVRTLDPADTYEIAGLNILYNVSETLYTYELGTAELVPLLAAEMPTVSDDALTYTIPLKEGITFQDGSPFNAEAMKFSLDRFIENGGKPSFLLADLVAETAAIADYTLEVTLNQPFAAFPSLLAFPGTAAVPPSAYEIGAGAFNTDGLVGTGPYQLASFSEEAIKLDPNPNYWGEAPLNEGIDIQVYSGNSANLFNGFRTGAVDIATQSLDPEQIKTLLAGAEDGDWQALAAPGTTIYYLTLNRNQEPLDQLEIRQAIASLIDRALIVERVLQGQGDPLYSLVPSAFSAYEPAFEQYGDGDFAQAKALLSEAGFSAESPAEIEIWHSTGSPVRGIVAQTLAALAEQELDGMLVFIPESVDFATATQNL